MYAKEVDHYRVLGLPSGEEGFKLTPQEITSAYRAKARQLHPDKRPDDPTPADFQNLQSSYRVLKDEKSRKLFDDRLRATLPVNQQDRQAPKHEAKRQKMVSELRRRERPVFESDPEVEVRLEKEWIIKNLREEIARFRATGLNKGFGNESSSSESVEKPPKVEVSKVVTPARYHEALERRVLAKMRNKAC